MIINFQDYVKNKNADLRKDLPVRDSSPRELTGCEKVALALGGLKGWKEAGWS